MKVLSSGSYKGFRKYNGDIYNIVDNLYYVMDGSTAVFDDNKFSSKGDLFVYMQNLKKYFKNNNNIFKDLEKAILLSNREFKNIDKYHEYELPTYTIAIVKDCSSIIEIFILSDALISILYKDGHVENIIDNRIDKVKEECRRNKYKIKNDANLSSKEKLEKLLLNEQITRMKVNVKGGFPVGSTKPESISQGFFKKIDKKLVDRILICTDGFYDSEEEYPKSSSEFAVEYVLNRVDDKLKKEKRDDLTYVLLEI